MTMDIQSKMMNVAMTANPPASVLKKDAGKTAAVAEVPKGIVANVNTAAKPAAKLEDIPKEKIQAAVNKLQDYVDKYDRDLKFSVDDDTGRTVVSLLDKDDNVVKQYPTEEALSLAHNLEQNKGLFIGQA